MNDWLQIDKVYFMQGLVVNNNNNKVALKPWNVWVYDFAAYERLATKDTQINGWKILAEHSKF